ncbi:hypothetical protein LPBF_06460 [Flavobacterium crassostreae]|uniref:Uncharacterized protein n=1 Tax=Flavobacterium crassostreae TaxID=1763534 RepID=A0A1B9E3Q7_9FLAO|nr:hypothetical protein LPBF_06460 [Flavobacterium crassostreae]
MKKNKEPLTNKNKIKEDLVILFFKKKVQIINNIAKAMNENLTLMIPFDDVGKKTPTNNNNEKTYVFNLLDFSLLTNIIYF